MKKCTDEETLVELVNRAIESHDSAVSASDFEQDAANVLDLLASAPELYSIAEVAINRGIVEGRISDELVAFWMHELRWKTTQDILTKMAHDATNPSHRIVLTNTLKSFQDDWRGAELYRRYRVTRLGN